MFFILQLLRLDFGMKANRNEEPLRTGLFIGFTFFCLAIYVYYGFFTTYVLFIEIGFSFFGIFFTFAELLLAVCARSRFS